MKQSPTSQDVNLGEEDAEAIELTPSINNEVHDNKLITAEYEPYEYNDDAQISSAQKIFAPR